MRKALWIISAIGIGLIAIVCFRIATNPLRRSDAEIRSFVQTQTPLGSSYTDVLAYVKKMKWDSPEAKDIFGKTEVLNIQGKLGDYQGFPFVTWVFVIWKFDSSSRLESIEILRISDAL
ncbi:MAG TPA: hypothetical protein VGP21_04820 [Opitutaceae bacterium]|jgi:hypothetical protein|nr:hypothetical protein [Opitutaceae bacterium]